MTSASNRHNHHNTTGKPITLLTADDDSVIREMIRYYAERAGIKHQIFESGDQLLKHVGEETLVCLLDLNMPGLSGMECLKFLKKHHPHVEVIILTSINQASEAVDAIREGAFDYITKPFDPDDLINGIRNAQTFSRQRKENAELHSSLSESKVDFDLLGNSAPMQHIQSLLQRFSKSGNPILITGESGTGKTLLARRIHALDSQNSGPFISVSCPSIPGELFESELFGHEKGAFSGAIQKRLGKVELANSGTLFLDEIGEMPLHLQSKLLTFLQEKSFYRVGGEKEIFSNARIITATNRELQDLVRKKLFREDLYFRLNVLPIEMPPLRERTVDLPLLVQHFVQQYSISSNSPPLMIDPGVYPSLMQYRWPGNVRELENAVLRACTLRKKETSLEIGDFDSLSQETSPISEHLHNAGEGTLAIDNVIGKSYQEIEKIILQNSLIRCGGNKAKTAKMLGIAEKSIYNKLKKHGL